VGAQSGADSSGCIVTNFARAFCGQVDAPAATGLAHRGTALDRASMQQRTGGAVVKALPTLALAFLILVGVVLIADSFHFDVPKGYLYFAMAFSVGVEMMNIRLRRLMDERRNKKAESDGG
jgi:hypothetical protein